MGERGDKRGEKGASKKDQDSIAVGWEGAFGKKKKKYIFRVMLIMQFQASLGMCLQDSKTETGLGTSYTLRWKRSQESKRRENKDL